ncbi:response regulator [Geotalea daltonii FRC-32]|uniref:Response regulator n=1 Tax=Geotalea daltonii (strain DSM 22248 / JCM 15807 / FRC-32) TaxID=316067 RepID=B9M658_GEODF|nr:response regulator [Geotalea daltonii]ACM21846.1 response regulator [Geotalea daltonii FRC-32]
MNHHTNVMLVDDEAYVISALQRALIDESYETTGVNSGEAALQLMEGKSYKVVISDERMPGMDGATFLSVVKERYPETVRIMLTGHASVDATMKAVNNGEIYRFFVKPWDEVQLKLAIRSAIEKYDLESENRRLLRAVRQQSQELKYLEQHYPGITELRRDANGAIRLDDDLSDAELADIVAQCTRGY